MHSTFLKKQQERTAQWQAKIRAHTEAHARRLSQHLQRRTNKIPSRRLKAYCIIGFIILAALEGWLITRAILHLT